MNNVFRMASRSAPIRSLHGFLPNYSQHSGVLNEKGLQSFKNQVFVINKITVIILITVYILRVYALLLLLIVITSCNGNDNTYLPKDGNLETQTILAKPTGINTPVGDPTFVEARDTISRYGPQSITRNVLQDKNGIIWLATWEGIICYDGKQFTNVTLKEGLAHFHVFSIVEDRAGNIWFGTIGGGVFRCNGKPLSDGQTDFRLFTTQDGLAGNIVECILEDTFGNIWFGTDGGVSRFDGNAFTNFTTKDGLSSNAVNSMAQDKFGNLWLGTRGGVNCYDGQYFTNFNNEKGLPFYRVNAIIEDKIGNIWIGSADELCRYDPSASLGKGVNPQTTYAAITASQIFKDKTGNLWLSGGTINTKSQDMTLTKYDGKSFVKIRNDFQIFGITEDKAGNIWFGTANGVCRFDGRSFNNFSNGTAK